MILEQDLMQVCNRAIIEKQEDGNFDTSFPLYLDQSDKIEKTYKNSGAEQTQVLFCVPQRYQPFPSDITAPEQSHGSLSNTAKWPAQQGHTMLT